MSDSLLTPWRHFATVGTVIECPEMRLDARDGQPPIVVGAGEISVVSLETFRFTLRGKPVDLRHTLRALNKQCQDPYDDLARFRLRATDVLGNALNGGWTVPDFYHAGGDSDWTFAGEIENLCLDTGPAPASGTEVLFLLPDHHSARLMLRRFVQSEGGDGKASPQYRMNILASDLEFKLDDVNGTLSIWAPASEDMPQTYVENWLGEPLRIMFGQLVFPRMTARANHDRTLLSVRPSRAWDRGSDWAAFWNGPGKLTNTEEFWATYAALLRYVALARNEDSQPNFEANTLTNFYEEVIQASRGSRWVWALTFASAVEGVLSLLVPPGARRTDANTAGIADLSSYIDSWPGGDTHLKQVAKGAVARTALISAAGALRDFKRLGVVSPEQVAAWLKVRNRVMHGNLVSPYSSEEDDAVLLNLCGLLHALTRRVLSAPSA